MQHPKSRMFYEGDLRSGIASALEQSKSVACFVAGQTETLSACPTPPDDFLLVLGEDAESVTWENEYLHDPEVPTGITHFF